MFVFLYFVCILYFIFVCILFVFWLCSVYILLFIYSMLFLFVFVCILFVFIICGILRGGTILWANPLWNFYLGVKSFGQIVCETFISGSGSLGKSFVGFLFWGQILWADPLWDFHFGVDFFGHILCEISMLGYVPTPPPPCLMTWPVNDMRTCLVTCVHPPPSTECFFSRRAARADLLVSPVKKHPQIVR